MSISARMNGSWIEVGGERKLLVTDVNPFFDVIDQHVPIGRQFARRQQQRMVAARIGIGDGPRGKPAATVCLQPFEAERAIEILAIFLSNFHLRLHLRWHGLSGFSPRAMFSPTQPRPRRDAPLPTEAPPDIPVLEQTLRARCASEETAQSVPPSRPYSPDC